VRDRNDENRRLSQRAICGHTIRLSTTGADLLHAEMVDVSRSGVRIRIDGNLLGIHRLTPLNRIARELAHLLGKGFEAEFHYEHIGPLVRKRLRLMRIAQRDWQQADVEIGCALDAPLRDEELALLGVTLPTPTDAPARLVPSEAPTPERVVWIHPAAGRDTDPLCTHPDHMTRGMAVLRVPDTSRHDFGYMDVVSVVCALDAAFGRHVTLSVVEGADEVWRGPAEIREVDVDERDPSQLRLGVAFRRELRGDELRKLGLPAPA
jgi:hypothetical protein